MKAERRDAARDSSGAPADDAAATQVAEGGALRAESEGREAVPAGRFSGERARSFEASAAPGPRRGASQNPAAGIRPDHLGSLRRSGTNARRDLKGLVSILAGLTVMVIPLSLYAWHRTQPRRDLERRLQSGRTREALARLQV